MKEGRQVDFGKTLPVHLWRSTDAGQLASGLIIIETVMTWWLAGCPPGSLGVHLTHLHTLESESVVPGTEDLGNWVLSLKCETHYPGHWGPLGPASRPCGSRCLLPASCPPPSAVTGYQDCCYLCQPSRFFPTELLPVLSSLCLFHVTCVILLVSG